MTEKDLRELDAWIGRNVFDLDVQDHLFGATDHLAFRFVENGTRFMGKLPKYTTDPAAAMEVLEKCLDQFDIYSHTVSKRQNTGYTVRVHLLDRHVDAEGNAETLPLAICLFAKQLFSLEKN